MKVYIVQEGADVVAVFLDKFKAEKYVDVTSSRHGFYLTEQELTE